MGESAGLALVPRPSVLAPHSVVESPWLELCWVLWVDTVVPPRSEREDGRGQTGLRGAPHPIPHVADPRAAESLCWGSMWACHPPWQSPSPASGSQSSFSAFCQSLCQGALEEAGCATSCAGICCMQDPHGRTATFSRCHWGWGPESGVLGRGFGHVRAAP